jgi:predicted amidophosphoribosyltransferase
MLALVTLWSYRLIGKMNAEQREDRLQRYERSTGTTYCRKCLYDLRSIEERCPECGTPIQAADRNGGNA